jgi:hypothetical protein
MGARRRYGASCVEWPVPSWKVHAAELAAVDDDADTVRLVILAR